MKPYGLFYQLNIHRNKNKEDYLVMSRCTNKKESTLNIESIKTFLCYKQIK